MSYTAQATTNGHGELISMSDTITQGLAGHGFSKDKILTVRWSPRKYKTTVQQLRAKESSLQTYLLLANALEEIGIEKPVKLYKSVGMQYLSVLLKIKGRKIRIIANNQGIKYETDGEIYRTLARALK